jgi:hypothetical protein
MLGLPTLITLSPLGERVRVMGIKKLIERSEGNEANRNIC